MYRYVILCLQLSFIILDNLEVSGRSLGVHDFFTRYFISGDSYPSASASAEAWSRTPPLGAASAGGEAPQRLLAAGDLEGAALETYPSASERQRQSMTVTCGRL